LDIVKQDIGIFQLMLYPEKYLYDIFNIMKLDDITGQVPRQPVNFVVALMCRVIGPNTLV
jgi:hypothetical protein